MVAQWSDLPEDLLISISKRTEHLSDYIRFGAVCKSWRSAITGYPRPLHLRFPMLLLARKTDDDDDDRRDHFLYSPLERKLHPLRLPDRSHQERCLGSSSDGWVCMVDDNLDLYLFNPFSGAPVVTLPSLRPSFMSVHLPDQDNDDDPEIFFDAEGGIGGGDYIRDVYLNKAIWSAEPTDPHCIVVLLRQYPYNLIYCRPGDAEWTVMGVPICFPCKAIFYKERLCVLGGEGGDILGFDLLHQRQYIAMPRLENFHFSMASQMYFAAGPSGLLIIVRGLKHVDEGEMVGFKVYKLDERERRWVETDSLDDGMLFLGLNTSMWFSSSNFHECKENSIYFMDEHMNYDGHLGWGGNSGIFHLEDGSFGSIYDDFMKPLYPRPVWVVPNP